MIGFESILLPQNTMMNALLGLQQSNLQNYLSNCLSGPQGMSPLGNAYSQLSGALERPSPEESKAYAWRRVESWADDAAKIYDRLTLWIEAYKLPVIGCLFAPIVNRICGELERCVENAESWLESAAKEAA